MSRPWVQNDDPWAESIYEDYYCDDLIFSNEFDDDDYEHTILVEPLFELEVVPEPKYDVLVEP